jgi:dTDP-4-amino-4,6-dideoxygalactose transaminase
MEKIIRRDFIKQGSIASAGALLTAGLSSSVMAGNTKATGAAAVLGGDPVRTKGWPSWPMWIPDNDDKRVIDSVRSGVWSREKLATEFEEKWAQALGAKRSLLMVNGTNSLITSLIQFNIGGGDEVIVPPYTFIATVAAVLAAGAIPVFADVDPETFQLNPDKIEAKITPRTRAIIPVHIAGLPANLPQILPIAKKHGLILIEDACQAHFAEINHQKVGTIGNAGCFSFQNSKNLPIGEGGAIVSNDSEFIDRCYSYHNYGNAYGSVIGSAGAGTVIPGTKLRITEYQAAIGLAQLKRLDEQTTVRNENAQYLTSKLKNIPGIKPAKLYDCVTRAAFHLYPFRYIKEDFKGMPRKTFLGALKAEGIPCSSGYATLNTMPFLANAFKTKNFKKMYSADMLDIKKYNEKNKCPVNDRLCNEEAVWFSQNMLLGSKSDMDDIARAIERIHENADKINKKI